MSNPMPKSLLVVKNKWPQRLSETQISYNKNTENCFLLLSEYKDYTSLHLRILQPQLHSVVSVLADEAFQLISVEDNESSKN